MGITRKMMSIGTMGAVDYRSDKERTAAYTKGMRKEARKQTQIMQAQAQQSYQPNPLAGWSPPASAMPAAPATPAPGPTPPPPPPPSAPPAAWYPDANTPGIQRYWDGTAWTEHTAPL